MAEVAAERSHDETGAFSCPQLKASTRPVQER